MADDTPHPLTTHEQDLHEIAASAAGDELDETTRLRARDTAWAVLVAMHRDSDTGQVAALADAAIDVAVVSEFDDGDADTYPADLYTRAFMAAQQSGWLTEHTEDPEAVSEISHRFDHDDADADGDTPTRDQRTRTFFLKS